MSAADLEQPESACQGAIGRHRLADGSIVAVRMELSRIDVGGWPAVLAMAIAVDDEERTALALREERFRQMLEAASDCFWETDETGRLIYTSPSFGTVFGLAAAEIYGKRLNDLPGVEIAPEMARMTVAAIKTRQPYRDLVCLATGARRAQALGSDERRPDRRRESRVSRLSRRLPGHHRADRGRRGIAPERAALPAIVRDRLRRSWEMDAEYRMSYVSPGYEAVVGVPASEALGKRFADTPGVRVEPEMGRMAILAQKERTATSSIPESSTMARYAGSR